MKETLLLASVLICIGPACGESGPTGAIGATGATGPQGAQGPQGANAPDASVGYFTLIEPHVGLLARELDVAVTADSVILTAATTLDFGDAQISVSKVQVVSPTTVYAHVSVSPSARVGPHDVTLGGGGPLLKGAGAFTVKAPLQVMVAAGTPKQGGLFAADLRDIDPNNFFAGPQGGAPDYTSFSGAGLYVLGLAGGATVSDALGIFLVEPSASPGNLQIAENNTPNVPNATPSFLSAPDALSVTAQSPTALALPYSGTRTLAAAMTTDFVSANAPGIGIVNYTLEVTDPNSPFIPIGTIFTATGKVADANGRFAPNFDPTTVTYYAAPPYHLTQSIPITSASGAPSTLVLFDAKLGGGAGFSASLKASHTPVSAITSETATPHATTATAQPLALPAIVTGTIATSLEVDAYAIAIPAGKVLEFSIGGNYTAWAGVPTDQVDLKLNPPLAGGTDSATHPAGGPLVSTWTFEQPVAPPTTTVYFVVSTLSTAASLGPYTLALRVLP